MATAALTNQIADWLIDQALGEPDIVEMFDGLCQRISGVGIPIGRARLTWPTLHPLFRAETVLWQRDLQTEFEQFNHQDAVSEAWMRSPMRVMLESNISVFRRRLSGPSKLLDFDIVRELAEEGYTDYLIIGTDFVQPGIFQGKNRSGIFVTWASDRASGFDDEDLAALQRVQRRFAVACKTVIQARISRNITHTYLGRHAGERVLTGSIRLGEAERTRAVVWYSDLRGSTTLAETMPGKDFLDLLNVYFECAAGPAIRAGGEVLAFIGDAALAIFPLPDEAALPEVAGRVFGALNESLALTDAANNSQRERGLEPIRHGIALNMGDVMFGNIGVPERLAFTAIGPTVIEVARIEKLTKTINTRILASAEIAALAPQLWRPVGHHPLDGVGHAVELFTFLGEHVAAEAA